MFEFSIIELCSEESLDDLEIYWIDKLRAYKGFTDSNGYNLTLGGQGNRQIRPVLRFDMNGNFLDEWRSPLDASISLGIDTQEIYSCANKKFKFRNGNIWIWKCDYIDESSLSWYLERKSFRKVLQYNKNGELLNTYDSKLIAEKTLGYNIGPCLSHATSTCHGYIFVYEDENIVVDKEYCEYAFSRINNICNHPFFKIDKNGEIVEKYNCQREAVEEGYCERLISECLHKTRNKHKGYLWVFVDEYDYNNKDYYIKLFNSKEKKSELPILQIKDGVVVNKYKRLKDLPDEFEKNTVSDVCKGRKKQHKGYLWKYEVSE